MHCLAAHLNQFIFHYLTHYLPKLFASRCLDGKKTGRDFLFLFQNQGKILVLRDLTVKPLFGRIKIKYRHDFSSALQFFVCMNSVVE